MTNPGQLSGGGCETVADDGQRCVRAPHPGRPDAHDFTQQVAPERAVDGGRSWREWIVTVNRVRDLLMPQTSPGTVTREGRVGEWPGDYCQAMLCTIAEVVGLKVKGNPAVIREE